MESAESASDSLGSRYAPDDPTLPKPWKGLIDGSTGTPETNVTRYEKPTTVPPQEVPLATHAPHQQGFPFLHSGQQQGSQLGQTQQQPGPQYPMHHLFSQHPQYRGHHMMQQTGHQAPPQHQGAQIGQPGHQATPQPFYINKKFNAGFPIKVENHRHSKQIGVPPSQSQQSNPSFAQNLPSSHSSNQTENQSGVNMIHQQCGPMFQNQMAPTLMHVRQPNVLTAGLNMNYDDKAHGRPGNDFRFSPHLEVPNMGHQHHKLASMPMPIHQQEMKMDGVHHPIATSVHGTGMQNMYHQPGSGPGFPSNAMMKPPSNAGNLSQADGYRQQYEITVSGEDVPAPFITFEATGFPPQILRELQLAGFASPTPIQAETWSISLRGRDIVAIAKTGSGKSLGYLIPVFIHLSQRRNDSQNGPTVLVLAPTQELATQIQNEAIKFGKSSRFSCMCLCAGAPKGPQLKEVERGAHIVVATPGRLIDILEMKRIDFKQVSLLLLDEADRMLDMGFEPQVRKIVAEMPPHRQTLMFTATWPKEVRNIAGDILVNPVQVTIGRVDELAANNSVTQHVEVVHEIEKQRRVEQIIWSQELGAKIIIFCYTKKMCDQLTQSIGRDFVAAAVHGDKSLAQRNLDLNDFRSGKCQILIATIVAAQELDIEDIRVLINYDFPFGIEDYIHRIERTFGRTGRAGATGVAYTFFCDQNRKHAADLVKVLEGANQIVPPEIREMASDRSPFYDHRGGMRDGGFGDRGPPNNGFCGRGGARDDNFGWRAGMRDGGFGGLRDGGFRPFRDRSFDNPRDVGFGNPEDEGFGPLRDRSFDNIRDGCFGDPRDGGFGHPRNGGFGGPRDGGFGSLRDGRFDSPRDGGRSDSFGGNRVRTGGWGRNERGGPMTDRYNSMGDRGRGRRRRQIDTRSRGNSVRKRGRSSSSSPERVRTRGDYGKSRSRIRNRSTSRSWSRSCSRSRSRGRSPSRSPSPAPRERNKRTHESELNRKESSMSESQPSTIPVSQEPTNVEKNELAAATGNGDIGPAVQS